MISHLIGSQGFIPGDYEVRIQIGDKQYVVDPDHVRPMTPREAVLISAFFMSAPMGGTEWCKEYLTHHNLWRHFREKAAPIEGGWGHLCD